MLRLRGCSCTHYNCPGGLASMKNNQRHVHFYDLKIRTSKVAATPPAFSDVLAVLKARMIAGNASHKIANDTETLTIKDIYVDAPNKAAVLLVTHTDPSSPNAVYSDPAAKKSRVAEKQPGEVGEFGAHVVVSLAEEKDRPATYLTLIERVTKVGRTSVERVVTAIVRDQCKVDLNTFVCEDRTGKRTRAGTPKMVDFRPLFELSGHPSDSFIDDLDSGGLTGMTLVQDRSHQQIGGRTYLKPEEASLRVSVDEKHLVQNLWADLKAALFQESKDWTRARISFKGADGRPGTAEVNTETGNVIDEVYVRSVSLTDPNWLLHDSADKVVPAFATRMIAELVAARKITP